MMDIERRAFDAEFVIERRDGDGEGEGEQPTKISGYAALFDSTSEPLAGGQFVERIAPGAFDDVLGNDVRALFNHDPNYVLGRTTAGTLELSTDDKGLRYSITPPDAQFARDLITSMNRGDVTQSSFGFTVAEDGDDWDQHTDGTVTRTIKRFGKLFDVSPVTYPAYQDTTVSARSLERAQEVVKVKTETTDEPETRGAERVRRLRLAEADFDLSAADAAEHLL